MIDFLTISTKMCKNGIIEIFPKFIIKKSKDLMIRGRDFYAVWIEDKGIWSTDEQDVLYIIDNELNKYVEEHKSKLEAYKILYMWDSETGMIDKWHRYCQQQLRDNFITLDEKLVFSNDPIRKEDYASKRLSYPLEKGSITAWDNIVGTLYDPEERHKIEWAIGCIVSGDSVLIQKFMVFYGAAGSGKSTIMNIIQSLFEGYYSVFDARALGSSSNSFALEAFKTNPLVAIQHDGDLSKIEDNTRINSLVSHEMMTVNEKFKPTYPTRFKAFLFMGTNKPVKITDAKSGLIRRLIDVTPSGNKLNRHDYIRYTKQVNFELGAIAEYCLEVYNADKYAYDSYIPISMLGSTNDFYNFVEDSYFTFKKENDITLKVAWEMYKQYCEDAKVQYPGGLRNFKEELKNYFDEFRERFTLPDGTRVRNYYFGFRLDKFENSQNDELEDCKYVIDFKEQSSIFDTLMSECLAQYANDKDIPSYKWDNVTSKLKDLDTSKTHCVKLPDNHHIVIDFDIKNENGEKDYKLNLEAASKWPQTYAELSKGGNGIHLHYIYTGDPTLLRSSMEDDPNVEIKVYNGNASLRRRVSKCNDLPIATISSGLPLKGDKKMVNLDVIKNEAQLKTMIIKNLNKEYHSHTKPSIDFIYTILEEAYNSGVKYDINAMIINNTSLRNAILAFAMSSTHNADYCVKRVGEMKFKSDEPSDYIESKSDKIVFFDIEIFPNLFLVNYKFKDEDKLFRLINPSTKDIENLLGYRLIGFNNRRYDNHMLYGCMLGYSVKQLYLLSQRIINKEPNCYFGEAYNLSYTDIYDFMSSGNKMGLKKWEIKLGIKHHELGLKWDEPVPEELWPMVSEYCDDDVLATEAVFNAVQSDWIAREILADLADLTPNDTTNTLTTRIIFGSEKKPQKEFKYRDLSKPVLDLDEGTYQFLAKACPEMMEKTHGEEGSLLPYFPGYKHEFGKSSYRGEDPKQGGYVYAEPGMYNDIALLDIASMHPHSAIAECLFGVKFTVSFREIVEGRVSIKHKAWSEVDDMLNGKLKKHVERVKNGELKAKELANGLKTAINSVYGLTSANFDNAFKDPRNIDNIVAKRGALFMINLKHEVQEKGFTVAHIKTDSIKIPNATPEIIEFVMSYGKRYGYTFEHEATYDRMCLINDAVYIAKFADHDKCMRLYGYVPDECNDDGGKWTATGKQFAVPYVFKTLFSKEDVVFRDLCETFNVTSAIYIDKNEDLPDVSDKEKELDKLMKEYKKKESDITIPFNGFDLKAEIAKGHNYSFVGKVGLFTPIKPGYGGGLLMRDAGDDKYNALAGTKGYRWLESEMVENLHKEDCVDMSYYDNLVQDAVDTMSKYGDTNIFLNN